MPLHSKGLLLSRECSLWEPHPPRRLGSLVNYWKVLRNTKGWTDSMCPCSGLCGSWHLWDTEAPLGGCGTRNTSFLLRFSLRICPGDRETVQGLHSIHLQREVKVLFFCGGWGGGIGFVRYLDKWATSDFSFIFFF